jgi:hypothetical protein
VGRSAKKSIAELAEVFLGIIHEMDRTARQCDDSDKDGRRSIAADHAGESHHECGPRVALFEKLVQIQMERALAVIMHPAVSTILQVGGSVRRQVTAQIANAMLVNLDKASIRSMGTSVITAPEDIQRLQAKLEALEMAEYMSPERAGSGVHRPMLCCYVRAVFGG